MEHVLEDYFPKSYSPQFDKLRDLSKQASKNIFRWQNLCRALRTENDKQQLRQFAKRFGVPQQFWNNPRKVCALITPRVSDFLDKVHCDNEEEPTMNGDPVGSIPEYLKYTYTAPNGKVYCSSIIDLYKWMKSSNTTQDPYRRFTFDPIDITERYEFLKTMLEPQALGLSFLDHLKEQPMSSDPLQPLRSALVYVWSNLHYPKFTVEEVISADVYVLDGIWTSLARGDGLEITSEENEEYWSADRDEKLRKLIGVMHRLVSFGNQTTLVALEDALNNSVVNGYDEDNSGSVTDSFVSGTDTELDSEDDAISHIEENTDYLTNAGIRLDILETYNPGEGYPRGSIRRMLTGDVRVAVQDVPGRELFNSEAWVSIFDPLKNYNAGDVVMYGRDIVRLDADYIRLDPDFQYEPGETVPQYTVLGRVSLQY